MNIMDLFPSRFLAASDFNGEPHTLTITGIEIEKMPDGTAKPSIWFSESAKPLLCNKTNAVAVANRYGVETSAWIGRPLELFPTTTDYKGQPTPCIRVRVPEAIQTAAEPATEPLPTARPALVEQSVRPSPFRGNGKRQPVAAGR